MTARVGRRRERSPPPAAAVGSDTPGAVLPVRNNRDTPGQPRVRNLRSGRQPTSGGSMFTSPDEVAAYIRDNDVEFVDVRFCDLPGVMQHFTIPASAFGEDTFSEGLGFDGSSIRGFQAINESDMLLLPDANSAFLDPFRVHKTLNVNFFIHDPITREAYSRDPRNVAKKAEAYLTSSGIADTAYFGPEAEFYVFDSIRHETATNKAYYYIDSIEGWWNTGSEENGGNRGYKTPYKAGYFPVPPLDHYTDLRAE